MPLIQPDPVPAHERIINVVRRAPFTWFGFVVGYAVAELIDLIAMVIR